MNSFETSQTDSLHPLEDEPEPLPITAELIGDLIRYIKELWFQLLQDDRDGKTRAELPEELRHAYEELYALKDELAKLQLPEDLREEIDYELWFGCYHARKVLEY